MPVVKYLWVAESILGGCRSPQPTLNGFSQHPLGTCLNKSSPGFEPTHRGRKSDATGSIVHELIEDLLVSANGPDRGPLVVILLDGALVGVLEKPGSDAHAVAGVGRHGVDSAIPEQMRVGTRRRVLGAWSP